MTVLTVGADHLDLLHDRCLRLMALIVGEAQQRGIELPQWQVVTIGPPAYDCGGGLVAVYLDRAFPGRPGLELVGIDPKQRCGYPRAVRLNVEIVRCVPVGTDSGQPPSPAELTASARVMMRDGMLLFDVIDRAQAENALAPQGNVLAAGVLTPLNPSGGLGGVGLAVEVSLT